MGYSPWGHKEFDTTEQLSLHAYSSQSLRKDPKSSSSLAVHIQSISVYVC